MTLGVAPKRILCILGAFWLAGCSAEPPTGPGLGAPDKELHAYISNQSFDQPTADLVITLNGDALFEGKAAVEGQHNWVLREADLEPGDYLLEALERKTGTRASESFVLPEGEQRWVVIDYWNDEQDGARFTFQLSEEQVYFA